MVSPPFAKTYDNFVTSASSYRHPSEMCVLYIRYISYNWQKVVHTLISFTKFCMKIFRYTGTGNVLMSVSCPKKAA